MKNKYYSLVLLPLFALASCNNEEMPNNTNNNNTEKTEAFNISVNGDFVQPEWVDLENTSSTRHMYLRAENDGFPKLKFTDLEQDPTNGFEPFVSVLWFYKKEPSDGMNLVKGWALKIEDDNDPSHRTTNIGTAKNKASGTNKGISRIIKEDGNYKMLIGFNVDGNNSMVDNSGENKRFTGYYPVDKFPDDMIGFIALQAPRKYGAGESAHRMYFPKPHKVEGSISAPPLSEDELEPLKRITGNYIIAENSNDYDEHKHTKLPFFSEYADIQYNAKNKSLEMNTHFKLGGALLALKFDNKTGKDIVIDKIATKSNDIAYSGFYELWQSQAVGGKLKVEGKKAPFFVRTVPGAEVEKVRNSVYKFKVQEENGDEYRLSAGAKTEGRFYLWGAIDNLTHEYDQYKPSEYKTLIQVHYHYADDANKTIYFAETVNVTPKGAVKNFEEGKAYLITVPVNKPYLGGFHIDSEHNYKDRNQKDF